MPWQLIFTSAPRGLTPGQSGYCTVARSRDLREGLISRLEKFSYYAPEATRNPVICAHRIVEVRGVRYHALSRIVDAGLDFTKRRKFIAHHLVFDPAELARAPSPATILLHWPGWRDRWESDPEWLDEADSLPGSATEKNFGPIDAWVSGDQGDRQSFLNFLEGSSWDLTFTNCFQPGDHPGDFRLRAIWPNTAGFDAAAKFGAEPIRLRDLKAPSAREIQAPIAAVPIPEAPPIPAIIPTAKAKKILWPWLAGAATLIAFAVAINFRPRSESSAEIKTPAPLPQVSSLPSARRNDFSNADAIFNGDPTWVAFADSGELGPAPELSRLFLALRDAELFGKDISASLQVLPSGKKSPATVDAQPRESKITFKSTDTEIELTFANGAVSVFSNSEHPSLLEIPARARILIIPKGNPIVLPKSDLVINSTAQIVSMHPKLEERLRKVTVPKGAQLALRPRDVSLEAQADVFGLSAATSFDLGSILKQANRVVREKARAVESTRREVQELKADEKKLLTHPKTPAEVKRKERLATLRAASSKATQELRALRQTAAGIPENLAKIDSFSLFLLQTNVSAEIIRFEETSP
jgi:hypothetical protein